MTKKRDVANRPWRQLVLVSVALLLAQTATEAARRSFRRSVASLSSRLSSGLASASRLDETNRR